MLRADKECRWLFNASSDSKSIGVRIMLDVFSLESAAPNDDYLRISRSNGTEVLRMAADACTSAMDCRQAYHTGECVGGVCVVHMAVDVHNASAVSAELRSDRNDGILSFEGVSGSWFSLHVCPSSHPGSNCEAGGSTCMGSSCFCKGVACDCSCDPVPHVEWEQVNIGILLPMFTAGGAHTKWSPRIGVYQAIRELNNKSDGAWDHLMPRTRLLVAYHDSHCDPTHGMVGALRLTRNAFDGAGVKAIIGAGCSDASVPASQVAGLEHVPIISPSSRSFDLSDGKAHPYFLRTVPPDSLMVHAMVDMLVNLFNYTSVALVWSEYGSRFGLAFGAASHHMHLKVSIVVTFTVDTVDFTGQQRTLKESGARVIVIFSQPAPGARFMQAALAAGIGGKGYLWLCGDSSFMAVQHWEGEGQRQHVLKGSFVIEPFNGRGSPAHDAYLERRNRLPPLSGDDGWCNLERDDDGGRYMWAEDVEDAEEPRCADDDPRLESSC